MQADGRIRAHHLVHSSRSQACSDRVGDRLGSFDVGRAHVFLLGVAPAQQVTYRLLRASRLRSSISGAVASEKYVLVSLTSLVCGRLPSRGHHDRSIQPDRVKQSAGLSTRSLVNYSIDQVVIALNPKFSCSAKRVRPVCSADLGDHKDSMLGTALGRPDRQSSGAAAA